MTDRIELLEAAFDNVPEGVGLFDGDGAVMFWNQSAQGISGYTALELQGRQLPECLGRCLRREAARRSRARLLQW